MIVLIFIALSLAATALVLFTPRGTTDTPVADPLQFYKDQLDDLEADLAAGKLSESDAHTARLEVQRRILRQGSKKQTAVNTNNNQALFLVLSLIVALGAGVFYMQLGAPNMLNNPARSLTTSQPVTLADGTTLNDVIKNSYAELKAHPDNQEMRWRLAQALMQLGRYSEAATLFGEGANRAPDITQWRISMGEAIMRMHDGQVVPAAMLAFRAVLKTEPLHPAAQYYIGLGQVQAGNKDLAIKIFKGLRENSAADAPWMTQVDDMLATLKGGPPTINQDDMAAVAGMTNEEQATFIESMVAQLEAKLADAPDDVEGWLMLARAKGNLMGPRAARETLNTARTMVRDADIAAIDAALDALD